MNVKTTAKIIGLILGFIGALLVGTQIGKSRGIPFIKKKQQYSIGIYSGRTPFDLRPAPNAKNPVLSANKITDVQAGFIADPFMINVDGTWHMFFEVFNEQTNQGDIGLAISTNGIDWAYKRIILDEPFHLSYPYVFKWEENYYMIPEACKAYTVKLYKACNFPTEWSFVKDLFYGNFFDSSIFRHNGRWWIFTSDRNDVLRLFHASDLMGPWIEHPKSPLIVRNAHIARAAGRVVVHDGQLIRYTQDCDPAYGIQVQAFKITELTTENYQEQKAPVNPILKGSGSGWNAQRMHHIDLHRIDDNRWIACVDGYREVLTLCPEF
jgi:hypothetical protein